MGGNSSKPSIISYEEAVKRLSEAEIRRIREAFKRSAGTNGSLLSKNAFLQEVLCEGTPTNIADWLFQACGGSTKGISIKDLISALVLITRGSQDEKIRFLWTLYSNDSSTLIIKNDFCKALQTEATYQSNTASPEPARSSINNVNYNYLSLFGTSSSVSFDQFRSWILIHKSATVLSKWLLVDSCVNISSDHETPTFYQSLAGVTHLEESHICELEKVFWLLKQNAFTGQLDIESLTPLLCPPLPRAALNGFFAAFDENCDGHIDFKELCCGVSSSCRGPDVERTKFCFKIFDDDRDGILNSTKVEQMIKIMHLVAKECCITNAYKNITFEQTLNDLHEFVIKNKMWSDNKEAYTKEFSLSQEDFLMWCVQSNVNDVSQPFSDLLFEVCHIVFGLRPQCKHLEFQIVKGWLSREVRRGYEVGQFWYLVSTDWWQQWLQYTQNSNQVSSCTYCKSMTRTVENADEAICDESCFSSNITESNQTETADSSSLGSGSSGISMGRQCSIPGPIDNSGLLAANAYKQVPTLTGEGGKLKREIPLVQHRDFELIPEALWKALAQWYGGPLALPRQVVKPPNTDEKELELYPLNLRILRHQQAQPNSMSTTSTNQAQASSWNSISGGYGALANASYSSTNSSNSVQTPKKYLAYTAAFSRLATVKQVGEFLCARLKLKQDTIRLWHMGQNSDVPYLLEDEPLTLEELNFLDNDQVLLEIRNKDLTWPEELRAISQNHTQSQDRRGTIASIASVHAPGATGLHNLGNTCFLNSALQVMFNTKPLTEYFRQNLHLFELNINNKMGTKGHLAIRYAELLKEILSAQTRSIAPLKFRFCVSKFAPQFAGGGQHDSQELLDWLLDTLHEDLNRVTEKPYIELKDSNGRSDQVVAAESWEATLQRNKSVIVDLFYGQMKSKVACETCGTESVRFDPFSLLSLPLPVENYTYCEVLVTKLDGSDPIKYGIRLNSECKYWDLKNHLSPMSGADPKSILLCQHEGSQIKCIFANETKINPNTSHSLFAYELPKNEQERSRAGSEIANIEKGLKDIQRNQDQQQLTTTSTTPSNSSNEDAGLNIKKNQNDQSEKVSRCFGNCMPSNLLCFKHSIDMMGTSPMGTFMDATTGAYNMKTVSTTNLLSSSVNDLPASLAPVNQQVKINGCTNCTNASEFDDDDISISSSRDNKRCINYEGQFDYLIAVHRKFTRQDTYFLSHHKTKPSLFGVPLLIPLHEGIQNKNLYCSVWVQVSRLLSPLPPSSTQNHAEDCDDSLGYDYPFTLRAVKENGQVCALCPWARFCRGCTIPSNEDMFLHGIITSSSCSSSNSSTPNLSVRDATSLSTVITSSSVYIAIDWDTSALHLRYQSIREKIFKEHSSLGICRQQQTEPVDLDHCLRAFTSEEKLEQTYYCSHCKSKQPATKKLQLWKLPPILIVHLKRFNFMNNKWVKSQKVVNFPFDNFDPTPYLASVPQETILRHKELLEQKSKNIRNHDCNDEITEFDLENEIAPGESRVCDIIQENVEAQTKDEVDGKSPTRSHPHHSIKPSRRKRLVSTSLTKTPIVDGDFHDFNNHKLKPNADPFDLKYKLYAVVSHSGMLNGGHYIAYASNANNKSWYCFNDSSCREIPQQPSIDPSSAYLLFYERQNLDYLPYLPKMEDKQPMLNGNELLEESDNDLKKMCVLS